MLEARNLTAMRGGRIIFSKVNLRVEPGERVQVVAPSGGGKTTLCRTLAGFDEAQEGEVLVDGVPLPRCGVCPVQMIGQHPEHMLDPRKTMEASLREANPEAARAFAVKPAGSKKTAPTNPVPTNPVPTNPVPTNPVPIDSVLAHDLRLLRNLGIKQEWFERYPQELSGGELQRFCIARALLAHPRYLIADEISTMLDGITQARLWQVILDETTRARIGLVFTTHSESLATHLMQF